MLLFTDISFWLVFVFFLAIYALIRNYSRVGMLLLPLVALVSWWIGQVLRPAGNEGQQHPAMRRLTLGVGIVVILLP